MNFSDLNDGGNESQDRSTGGGAGGGGENHGGDELAETLSDQDTEFVATERKPINQSVLMLFAIIVIGAAGMYVMYLRTGPKSAKAADPAAVNAETAINNFMK